MIFKLLELFLFLEFGYKSIYILVKLLKLNIALNWIAGAPSFFELVHNFQNVLIRKIPKPRISVLAKLIQAYFLSINVRVVKTVKVFLHFSVIILQGLHELILQLFVKFCGFLLQFVQLQVSHLPTLD